MSSNLPQSARSLPNAAAGGLLAVDCGMRFGLAHYGRDGRLRWVGSRHLGSMAHLKRAAAGLLLQFPGLDFLVLEGGGAIAEAWLRAAADRCLPTRLVSAELWRAALLPERKQRTGAEAKQHAIPLARDVIRWSGVRPPHKLGDDAAEAILAGLHGVILLKWVPEPLPFLTLPRVRKEPDE